MSGLLGKLNVLLSADTAQFTGAMDKAAYKANKTMNGILRTVRGVAPQLAAAFSAAAVTSSFKKIIDDADELNKMAQKVGVTTEALSVFRYQAKLANVDFEGLTTGIARFSRVVVEASKGMKGPARAFDELNIKTTDSEGRLRSTQDLILEVADRFSVMEDGIRKAALAQELFGRSGVNLIPLLNEGSAGFARASQEAEKYGIIVSSQLAKAEEQFNDNLTRLESSLYGVLVKTGNEIIPILQTYTEQILNASDKTSILAETTKVLTGTIEGLLVGTKVTAGFLEALGKHIDNTISILSAAKRFDFQEVGRLQKQAWEDLNQVYQKTVVESMALIDSQEKLAQAAENTAQRVNMAMDVQEDAVRVEEEIEKVQKVTKETSSVMREMGATFTSSFEDAIISGGKFSDVLKGLLEDIERILLRKLVLEPLFNSIFDGMGSFFGGANTGGAVSPIAHGNVLSGGNFMRFANGGIFTGPTMFPMAGGRRGLAGEAGEEAIIPLQRTSAGDLGVKADLGGRVQVNVYAPPGSNVKEERKSDGGMESINIYIDEAVAGNISRSGSKTQRALKNQFGLGQELTRR